MVQKATANADININANTQQTQEQIEKLENTIKTLDGTINIVGGSIETIAGGLALTGAVSEEQAKQFEAMAVGAIAFADGTKRTIDGVKTLQEGLKSAGGIMGVVKKAQAALNATILANPYVAAAVAVAALAAGLYLLATRETEEEKANALALETAKLRLQNLEESETRVLAFARAQGLATETVLEFEQASIKARIAELDRILALEEDAEEYKKLSEEQNKLLDKEIEVGLALGKVREDARQKDIADNKKAGEQKLKDDKEAAQKRFDELNKENQDREERIRIHEENVTRIQKTEADKRIADRIAIQEYYDDLDREAFEKDVANLRKRQADGAEAVKTAEEQAQALSDARNTLLGNTAAAVGALASIFQQGTAEYKAAALAEIAISTATGFINALDIAQKSAKATGPAAAFAFPIFYASQIAAVLGAIASAKQVLASTPGGSSGIKSANPSSRGAVGGGFGNFTGFLPGTGPTNPLAGGGTGLERPIRAYVVTQDVTNGQEAAAAINRRRRLGPG